jgi:hypothetical protein
VQDFSVIAYSLRQSTSMIHPHHTARRRFPVTSGRMSLYVCASRPACRRCHRKLYSTELTYSRHGLEFQKTLLHAPCGRESNKAKKGKINSKQQRTSRGHQPNRYERRKERSGGDFRSPAASRRRRRSAPNLWPLGHGGRVDLGPVGGRALFFWF